jgi:hypothetical protein
VDDSPAILEVECGCGRHLAHLPDLGFENLADIDTNDESFDVMTEHYSDLAETGTFVVAG